MSGLPCCAVVLLCCGCADRCFALSLLELRDALILLGLADRTAMGHADATGKVSQVHWDEGHSSERSRAEG